MKDHSSKKSVWKRLYQVVVPYRRGFFMVVFFSLLSTGTTLIEPLIYREAINDIAGLFVQQATEDTKKEYGLDEDANPITDFIEKKLETVTAKEPHTKHKVAPRTPDQAIKTLLWSVGLLFMINVIGQIFWYLSENKNVKFACRVDQTFVQRTFSHVLKLPLGFFGKRSSAALAKQINQSEEISAIVNGFSQEILPEVISLIGILTIMFTQHVTLTFIALAIIPIYLLIAWRSANKLESGLSSYYDRWEEVSSRIQDSLSGIKTVKLSGAEDREVEKLQKISDDAYADYINRTKLANKYIFWETVLTRLSSALVLGYGGYLTLEKQLTPGDVVMFVAYLDRLYGPIDSLASLWVNLQQNIASVSRAFKLLQYGHKEKPGKKLELKNGTVEFKNVHFSYNPNREVLKGISFNIEPGKVTAIVGPSGSGKTTAVDLLLKLYDVKEGAILIDGQDLGTLDSSSVRQQIGMVAADGAIFRGTLADNIRYKRPAATDAEVETAAYAAGMQATIQRFPEGLKTPVGESGLGLSVGERQRIQIARVLSAKPRILILDEATANLDYATEAEIKKTVDEIRKQNTVVIIAHRFSMVRDADHVIVLNQGKIHEQGSPQQLIEKGGWFAKFAAAAADSVAN